MDVVPDQPDPFDRFEAEGADADMGNNSVRITTPPAEWANHAGQRIRTPDAADPQGTEQDA